MNDTPTGVDRMRDRPRQTIYRRVAFAASILASFALTYSRFAAAQSVSSSPLVGTWSETVYVNPNTPAQYQTAALISFSSDDTLTDVSQQDLLIPTTPGHGVWLYGTGAKTATVKIERLYFGNYYKYQLEILSGVITFTGQNTYTASGTITAYSSSGGVTSINNFAATGVRMTLP